MAQEEPEQAPAPCLECGGERVWVWRKDRERWTHECRACKNERSAKYREKNLEKVQEKERERRERYLDESPEKYREKGREHCAKYREKNLEKLRKRHVMYRKESPEKYNERSAKYREKYRNAGAAPRVYFIAPPGLAAVKIGMTANNPLVRLRDLQTGHHERLSFLAYARLDTPEQAAALEKRLHDLFAEERAACEGGSEWFVMSPRMRQFIERVRFDDPRGRTEAVMNS